MHSDVPLKASYRKELNADSNNNPSGVKMIRSVLLECYEKQVLEEQAVVNVEDLYNHVRVKLVEK